MLRVGQYAPVSARSSSGRHASPRAYILGPTHRLVASAQAGHGHNFATCWPSRAIRSPCTMTCVCFSTTRPRLWPRPPRPTRGMAHRDPHGQHKQRCGMAAGKTPVAWSGDGGQDNRQAAAGRAYQRRELLPAQPSLPAGTVQRHRPGTLGHREPAALDAGRGKRGPVQKPQGSLSGKPGADAETGTQPVEPSKGSSRAGTTCSANPSRRNGSTPSSGNTGASRTGCTGCWTWCSTRTSPETARIIVRKTWR